MVYLLKKMLVQIMDRLTGMGFCTCHLVHMSHISNCALHSIQYTAWTRHNLCFALLIFLVGPGLISVFELVDNKIICNMTGNSYKGRGWSL